MPRVGHITFLNSLPLYWGLERTGGLDGLDLVADTPDRLSDALVAGTVDIGPISLVEYLRHHRDLLLLPDLAVAAQGPVQSVVLASRYRMQDLDRRTVALGSTSRTSVMLARLLLEDRYGVRPRYRTERPDLPAMLRRADAAVLIGDPALRATLSPSDLTVTDLAAQWYDWTGLPMVFAVWAVRRDYWNRHRDRTRTVIDALHASRAAVAGDVERVARDVAETHGDGLRADDLARYFEAIDFSLQEHHLKGIDRFAHLVAPLAGTDADVIVEFAGA